MGRMRRTRRSRRRSKRRYKLSDTKLLLVGEVRPDVNDFKV